MRINPFITVNFHRQGISKLLEWVCTGEISKIAISYKDRLARIGFEIFEQICKLHECEIIVVNNIDTSPEEELVEDLVAIITSFSARIHGLQKYSEKVDKNFSKRDWSLIYFLSWWLVNMLNT